MSRKCEEPNQELRQLMYIAQRIFNRNREDKDKVYSVHAQEVECISKGKARQRYEFGCVRVVTTSKGGWVVGIDAEYGNPYDGHTLKPAVRQVEELTGVRPKQAFVNRGFKRRGNYPEGIEVYISGRRVLNRTPKAMLRRRSGIEPIIGHMKQDHGMERNHLLGKTGDRINAILSGCGFNLRKLVRAFSFVLSDRVMQLAA